MRMHLDSVGGKQRVHKPLFKYLQQEHLSRRGSKLDTSGWSLQWKKRSKIPQQKNCYDCGMFTCKYAEYITRDRPITFSQDNIPYFRRRMVWEIVNRKLL